MSGDGCKMYGCALSRYRSQDLVQDEHDASTDISPAHFRFWLFLEIPLPNAAILRSCCPPPPPPPPLSASWTSGYLSSTFPVFLCTLPTSGGASKVGRWGGNGRPPSTAQHHHPGHPDGIRIRSCRRTYIQAWRVSAEEEKGAALGAFGSSVHFRCNSSGHLPIPNTLECRRLRS